MYELRRSGAARLQWEFLQSLDFGNFVELAENAVFREPYSMEWIKSREPLQD
jgi:hypothetical protein